MSLFSAQPFAAEAPSAVTKEVLIFTCAIIGLLLLIRTLKAAIINLLRLLRKAPQTIDPPTKKTASEQLQTVIYLVPVAIIVFAILVLLYQWFQCYDEGHWTEFPISLLVTQVLPPNFTKWAEGAGSSPLAGAIAFVLDIPLTWFLLLIGGGLMLLLREKLPFYTAGRPQTLSGQLAVSHTEIMRLRRDLSKARNELKHLKDDLPADEAPQDAAPPTHSAHPGRK